MGWKSDVTSISAIIISAAAAAGAWRAQRQAKRSADSSERSAVAAEKSNSLYEGELAARRREKEQNDIIDRGRSAPYLDDISLVCNDKSETPVHAYLKTHNSGEDCIVRNVEIIHDEIKLTDGMNKGLFKSDETICIPIELPASLISDDLFFVNEEYKLYIEYTCQGINHSHTYVVNGFHVYQEEE